MTGLGYSNLPRGYIAVIGNAADFKTEGVAAVAVTAENAPLAATVVIQILVILYVPFQISLFQGVLQRTVLPGALQLVGVQDQLVGIVAVAGEQRNNRVAAVNLAVIQVLPFQR